MRVFECIVYVLVIECIIYNTDFKVVAVIGHHNTNILLRCLYGIERKLFVKIIVNNSIRELWPSVKNVPPDNACLCPFVHSCIFNVIFELFALNNLTLDCKIAEVLCTFRENKRNLIEEKGRLDAPGRPILFGTTQEFLRCFGVPALQDLPEFDSFGSPENEGEQISMELEAEQIGMLVQLEQEEEPEEEPIEE